MTLPGKMLTDAVTRLSDTIAAAKQASDDLKAATVPQPQQPIPTQEVNSGASDRGQSDTA